jgi:DNA-binding NarL/FixJ family response regulator
MSEKQALLVDDHPIIRESLKQLLQKTFPSILIRESTGADSALEEICSYPWTFVILDINLPSQNGLRIIRKIQTCCPQIPIIVFSLFSENQYRLRALRAGAVDYVSKEGSPLKLVDVIKCVLRGKTKASENIIRIVLSPRETEILTLLAKGMNRQEIAQALTINENIVSTYKARLLQKLDARNTVDLLRLAAEEGLLGDSD